VCADVSENCSAFIFRVNEPKTSPYYIYIFIVAQTLIKQTRLDGNTKYLDTG